MRDLKRRGMRAPELAVGDGALGFWAAVRDVWPETREQRDWVHVIANVLDKLPKRLRARAKELLLSTWRKQRDEGAYRALARSRGPRKGNPLKAENAKLRRKLERAEAELAKAHKVIEVQGNVSTLLGELLEPRGATPDASTE